ncbi:DUF4150 domain-containing protein [Paralcaligenes sp. KSB-10]|uniref:DUF4150 domain-containing protein n=1 Tax=Paralcaligenes sp. KSB-10 TaxID=2901142 RepID=UPI001E623123|nr:DUF4150 domain-containing protein [Paralcaligenes sp. KSB-10]UHL65679.1 DUF4150 domain-containing protein [Paralcaligenes sp. KSB-10]
MFMLTTGGAMTSATVPDICKTQVGPAVVPIPYPNLATTLEANPGAIVENVLVVAMPALNVGSSILMSNGDQAGIEGGVVSSEIMGEVMFTTSSVSVMVGGMPAVRLTDMTTQNSENTIGLAVSPGEQVVVMAMS